jgi:hypothetical protein
MPIEKQNNFINYDITYKTFFDLNEEYYKVPYINYTFKLFDKDDADDKYGNDDMRGKESPLLKIEEKMTPPTGYNGKMVRKIRDAITNEDLSNNTMKIRRVEAYNKNSDTVILVGKSSNRLNSKEIIFGGGRKASVKKEVCGKLRCIYKIPGSRKEHLKYKGRLITVAEYKKLMKAKSI